MEKESLGLAIIKGACNAETKDIAVDLGELGIDAVFAGNLAHEIPVIKTVLASIETGRAIRDHLFLRKVLDFLKACPKFTQAEKERFADEHLRDGQKAKRLSDSLVLILEKLDDFEKPKMLAKCFAALVRGEITSECFRRLASAIDIGFIEDLEALADETRTRLDSFDSHLPNLLRTNLAVICEKENPEAYMEGDYRVEIKVSRLGEAFIECMVDRPSST